MIQPQHHTAYYIMSQHSIAWHSTAWHSTVHHRTLQHNTEHCSTAWHCTALATRQLKHTTPRTCSGQAVVHNVAPISSHKHASGDGGDSIHSMMPAVRPARDAAGGRRPAAEPAARCHQMAQQPQAGSCRLQLPHTSQQERCSWGPCRAARLQSS